MSWWWGEGWCVWERLGCMVGARVGAEELEEPDLGSRGSCAGLSPGMARAGSCKGSEGLKRDSRG